MLSTIISAARRRRNSFRWRSVLTRRIASRKRHVDQAPYLAMRGIAKSYPGVRALDGVDFDVRSGEVHALVGENGAGKSTLMKILAGAVAPDAGEIDVDGKRVTIASPRDAERLRIAIIYQESNLVPGLDVAANVLLGREPVRSGRLDHAALYA